MTEIKKTLIAPPSRLVKKVVSLSKADNWEEAIKEWSLLSYYYVEGYHACLCSPRGVHNIIMIENVHNSNRLEICNPCADLYFKIREGLKIESIVRRLKEDIDLNMDKICLEYLLNNNIINNNECKNYKIVRLSRKKGNNRFYRQQINKRLLNFVDYRNKEIFEKIECIILWSDRYGDLDCLNNFIAFRKKLLNEGVVDIDLLDDFIREHRISLWQQTILDRECLLELIEKYSRDELELEGYEKKSKLNIKERPSILKLTPQCLIGLENPEPSMYDKFKIKRDKEKKTEGGVKGKNFVKLTKKESDYVQKVPAEAKQPVEIIAPKPIERHPAEHADVDKRRLHFLNDCLVPSEIIDSCKLKPENLSYVYKCAGDSSEWKRFNWRVSFPIQADEDVNALAILLYERFVDITSMTLLEDFFKFFDKEWVLFVFSRVPFHKDLTEITYICNFIRLLNVNQLAFILGVLYEDTEKDTIRKSWITQLNDILRKYSYEIFLEGNSNISIKLIGNISVAKVQSLKEFKALPPSKLMDNNGIPKESSYKYELFGFGYWEFVGDKKSDRKLNQLDNMYKKTTFPFEEKVLLTIAYFMYEWCVTMINSHLFYYMVKYFDNCSFSMAYNAVSSLLFPFKDEKQWINMFWILLLLKKTCIESLLGQLYMDEQQDGEREKRLANLNEMLLKDNYEAKFQRNSTAAYIRVMERTE